MSDAELAQDHLRAIKNIREYSESLHDDDYRQITNALVIEVQHWRRKVEKLRTIQPPWAGEAACDEA